LPVFFTEYPRLDMRSDGQQFLIKTENRDGDAQAAITVAMNWQAAMRR
jgi:hypothetical protein